MLTAAPWSELVAVEKLREQELEEATPLELLEHVFEAIQKFRRDTRRRDDMTAAAFHYS